MGGKESVPTPWVGRENEVAGIPNTDHCHANPICETISIILSHIYIIEGLHFIPFNSIITKKCSMLYISKISLAFYQFICERVCAKHLVCRGEYVLRIFPHILRIFQIFPGLAIFAHICAHFAIFQRRPIKIVGFG